MRCRLSKPSFSDYHTWTSGSWTLSIPHQVLGMVNTSCVPYCLANISALGVTSTEFCQQLLAEEEVATTPMVAWGSDAFGHQHVRFIFTNEPEDRLREAVQRIARFVQRHYAA